MSRKSILVVFGEKLPKKKKSWWRQFDEVWGPKEIEALIGPGSIHRAYDLANRLARMTLSDGSRISKAAKYQGHELWWMNYDTIYEQFCLPYTQYADLLERLKGFGKVFLFQAPSPKLFQYFLRAHGCQYYSVNDFRIKNFLPVPFGVFIQLVLSFLFLPMLAVIRPKIVLWANDKFNYPYDFDFRKKPLYDELRKRAVPFAELIRSVEPWRTVLRHALLRKRPVIYATALITALYSLAACFSGGNQRRFDELSVSSDQDEYFWRLAATHYLHNIRGTIWSIGAMKLILRLIGAKVAIMISGGDRTFHTVLACKLVGIPTIGIQHGATPRHFLVADFMPEFDGAKVLSLDKYGLWSEWWRDYYLKHSRAFKKEQLFVSGSPRPLEKENEAVDRPVSPGGPVKVLFISEQVAEPKEVMPYLQTLLEMKEFEVVLKFRPQADGFEEWLKNNNPEMLKKVNVSKGNIHEATVGSDVVVGSQSTAVLEGLMRLKPIVFFRTKKWGDYFEAKDLHSRGCSFAENPSELVSCIKKSLNASHEELRKLREQFFGNPFQNGAKWLVDQAVESSSLKKV